jgi:hypothetical protein
VSHRTFSKKAPAERVALRILPESKGWVNWRNIEEWIEEFREWSRMVEKEICKIGRRGRLRKQNKDGVKSRKAEARIREGRGRWMMGSRNVNECR